MGGMWSDPWPLYASNEDIRRVERVRENWHNIDVDTRKIVEDVLKEQKRMQQKNKDLQIQLNSVKILNRQLTTSIADLESKIANQKDDVVVIKTENITNQHGLLQKTETSSLLEECLREQRKLETDKDRLRQENKVLSKEKEDALTRLSKFAGIQMTKGNSNITDLSDINRPTQLAEKWSSLYTEEWTEAYDELTMKKTLRNDDYKAEKELGSIAKKCYSLCKEMEEKQIQTIRQHIHGVASCLHKQPDQETEKTNTLSDKAVVGHTKDVGDEDSIQRCIGELLQVVHERRKYDKNLNEYVTQEVSKHFQTDRNDSGESRVLAYVKKCAELCWSMVIKEPPIVLLSDHKKDEPFDKELFSPYTLGGDTIDFVIWPALLLHKDGPVLAKGTAQGKKKTGGTALYENMTKDGASVPDAEVETASNSTRTTDKETTPDKYVMPIYKEHEICNSKNTPPDNYDKTVSNVENTNSTGDHDQM